MADAKTVPAKVRSIWPPLVLGALALGFVIWAQDYDAVPRLLPTIMGSITVILCFIDFLSRQDTSLAKTLQLALGADFNNPEMGHNPSLRDEAIQAGWMISFVISMLFIGILATVPFYIAAYMRLFGKRSWVSSLLAAGLVFGFVVLVFEVFLGTTLYRGVLLDPKGFGAW